MNWKLVGTFSALALCAVDFERPSDACGVKLIVKTPTPRQVVPSASPSDVLIVGPASGRLTRQLAAKGHTVEVTSDPAAAKRGSYAVVVTDPQHERAARAKFGDDVVVVRSDDVAMDVKAVESQVGRRPMRASSDRAVVAARADRKPIAAGPERRVVAAKPDPTPLPAEPSIAPEPRPTPPVAGANTAPAPDRVAVAPPKPSSDTTEAPDPEPKRKPAQATVAPSRQEIYFGVGSSKVSARAEVAKAAKWLNANPDVTATIEGHADPTGTPEGNQALSQQRAEMVRDLLVNAGVDASRLEVVGFGDTQLKYPRTDGRNRRVAIEPKR
jgi:peptidoglycan-associated lipoprotein